jgi:glutamate dehydrogenase/leucine dehydrogenase
MNALDAQNLIASAPSEFVSFILSQGIRRFSFVFDEKRGSLVPSHPQLQPVADYLTSDGRDFAFHEGLFFQLHSDRRTLLGAFVHRTCRGQAAGGVRYWHYDSMEDYFRDGLRLAKGMTRKCALAGLWWGGGKGVICHHPDVPKDDPSTRAEIYRAYGRFMTSLCGCYVTAEDVGTGPEDMSRIFEGTRFVTCMADSLGGSGNPSEPTARGVIAGMEAALSFLNLDSLKGKTVAVQGMGNVAGFLIEYLLAKDVKQVVATDINSDRVHSLTRRLDDPRLHTRISAPGDATFLSTDCDILAPCATGAILNPDSISDIKARIVCGAANNQLEDAHRDDALLMARGITYVPDFLTNRMGIVTCSNEQYGYITKDPAIEQHLSRDWEHSIHQTTMRVLNESDTTGDPPGLVALRQADRLSLEVHPIFGHRGRQIIDSLIQNRWHEQEDA